MSIQQTSSQTLRSLYLLVEKDPTALVNRLTVLNGGFALKAPSTSGFRFQFTGAHNTPGGPKTLDNWLKSNDTGTVLKTLATELKNAGCPESEFKQLRAVGKARENRHTLLTIGQLYAQLTQTKLD